MTTTKKSTELGAAEVDKKVEQEQEDGYRGHKVDPLPNSAHSLESGPAAPPLVPDPASRLVQHSSDGSVAS